VIRSLLIVAGLSALDPCALDGADDGGTVEAGPAQTVGTQCTAIVTELCTQGLSRCALSYEISDCVASAMPQCCSSGNTCNEESTSSEGDVNTCKSDIDTTDCNFIVNAVLPDSCQELLHP
jgi:hypothetical protein